MIPINITITENDGTKSEAIVFQDNRGLIFTEEEFQEKKREMEETFKKASEAYERNDIDNWIDRTNKTKLLEQYVHLSYELDFLKDENGKYKIPSSNVNHKNFNSEKRNWSFTCDWCGEKVSSKTEKSYYSLKVPHLVNFSEVSFPRGCSQICADHLWRDLFKDWIHTNGFDDLFDY